MFTFRENRRCPDDFGLADFSAVAKYLNTEVDHGVEDQKRDYLRREQKLCPIVLIVHQEQPIGHISISEYNPAQDGLVDFILEKRNTRTWRIGTSFFYSFCFSELVIERIDAEMLYFNTKVIDLHQLHGYEFAPERDRIWCMMERAFCWLLCH